MPQAANWLPWCAKCDDPLTGSCSKGRARKYAYYHCPKCRGVKVRKDLMEERYLMALEAVRPSPGYMRLFKEVILDVWERRHAEARRTRERLEANLAEKRRRLDRVEDAFPCERSMTATAASASGTGCAKRSPSVSCSWARRLPTSSTWKACSGLLNTC